MAGRVEISFDADLKGFVQKAVEAARAVQGVEGGVEKLGAALTKTQKHIDDTSKGFDKKKQSVGGANAALDSMMVTLAKYAGAAAVTAQGIKLVTDALNAEREAALAAAAANKANAEAQRKSGFIPPVSLKEKIASQGVADSISLATGIAGDRATLIAAQSRREQFTPADAMAFSRAEAFGGIDATAAIEGLSKVKENFPESTLTGEQLINKVVGAAQKSGADPSELLAGLGKVMSSAKQVGATEDETFATLSAAGELGTGKKAAASLNSISDFLADVDVPLTADERVAEHVRTGTMPGKDATRKQSFQGAGWFGGLRQARAANPAAVDAFLAKNADAARLAERGDAIELRAAQNINDRTDFLHEAEVGAMASGQGETIRAQIADERKKIAYREKGYSQQRYAKAQRDYDTNAEAGDTNILKRGVDRAIAGIYDWTGNTELGTKYLEGDGVLGGSGAQVTPLEKFRRENQSEIYNRARAGVVAENRAAGRSSPESVGADQQGRVAELQVQVLQEMVAALNRNTAATQQNTGSSAQLRTADSPAHDGVGNVQKPAQRVH